MSTQTSLPSRDYPIVITFDESIWARESARLIQDSINGIVHRNGKCTVMLTGGKTAELLYREWRKLLDFQSLSGVNFYFGDERCVDEFSEASNYRMTMTALFQNWVQSGCAVFRMMAEWENSDLAARHYEAILPSVIDILLLGVGEDGHIASIFPGSSVFLNKGSRSVESIVGSKSPFRRLTITPKIVNDAKNIFVLAPGSEKKRVLDEALKIPSDISRFPARMTLSGVWLMS